MRTWSIAKGVPTSLVGRLLLSLLPPFFEITLPASLLLAVLLGLGRLAADSETTALSAAGVGMRGVALPVLVASVITCAAVLLTGWHGVPWGYRETQSTLARIVSERAGAGAAGRIFREITPEVLVYPDRVSPDGQRMSGVFLSFRPAGDDPLLVFAREGRFVPATADGVVGLELSDGTIHGEPTGKPLYRTASFGRMTFLIPLEASSISGGDNAKGMTLPELSRKIDATGGRGRTPPTGTISTGGSPSPYPASPSACSRSLSGSPCDPGESRRPSGSPSPWSWSITCSSPRRERWRNAPVRG